MRILILGGGLAGVGAAYYLARDGHEVEVLDRRPAAASESSFANAGLLTLGHTYAWATPEAPLKLLRAALGVEPALRVRLSALPGLWRWGLRFLAECPDSRVRANTARKVRLTQFALECHREVVAETGVEYDRATAGTLYLFRTEKSREEASRRITRLRALGVDLATLEPPELVRLEPALASATVPLTGAVHSTGDETGDPCTFTRALAAHCAEHLGVTLTFGAELRGIETDGARIRAVHTDAGMRRADRYVLALGCDSAPVARSIGLRLPIYPVKGYSVTLPVRAAGAMPTLGGIDEDLLVAYSPLGARLRVTSVAEFAGHDRSYRERDFAPIIAAARDLFPEAADYAAPSYWSCLRPSTPDGPPILGPSPIENLVLCTGHGTLGWTWACGTGRIVADLIAGRDPGIDLRGLGYR